MVFLIGKLNAWDASATDGLNCKGFSGVGSDGEYNYYTPYHNGSAYHGIVLRQKIYSIFKDAGTWEAYDAGTTDGFVCTGFFGNPIFDGQFMYFVPSNNGSVSGEVLRYDTTKPFKSASSWDAVSLTSMYSVGSDLALWRYTYSWSKISTHAIKKVSVGADGTIGAIDNATGAGLIWSPATSSWVSIGGVIKDIAVYNSTTIYGIGSDDNLYLYNGSWNFFASGPIIKLSVSYDGCIAVTDSAGSLYIKVNGTWSALGGVLKEIAAYKSNEVYGIGGDDRLWRNKDGVWSNIESTTTIKLLSISAEGEIYVTNTANQIMFFNGSTYVLIGGSVLDISCANSMHYACGFRGAVFDGQFIYFVPYHNGAYNGIVLRYDTTKPFKSSTSWEAYDLGGMAGGAAKGYWGAVVLDNFIYFSPYQNAASTYHGQILRYDMTKPFKSASAWTVFNAATVSANCKGLGAPCTDGQFVYFPNAVYGLVLRYDSTLPFNDSGSYATFDIANLSENTESHNSCCVQGHYVAFSPSRYTILVYDTEKPFSDSGSWTEKEVAGADNSDIWGFLGSYSDPNYVYFAPYQQYASLASSVHGTVLRGRIDPCPSQVFPSPAEENFSEYMLDDVGDYLSVSSGRVSAVGMEPDIVALLYQDYNKDCFDGFEIRFDLRISSIVTYSDDGDYGEMCTLSLSNRHSSYDPSLTDANDPCICFVAEFAADRSLDGLYLYLCKIYTTGTGYLISTGTTYYCKLTRPDGGNTVTLRIYSNAARTTLLATLTESGFPTSLKWRYIYAMRGSDSGEWQASYYLENLNVVSY